MTGREAERYVAEYLALKGFFVGDFNKGTSGEQPFDQIAIGKDLVIAYDVKHCAKDYFPLNRVEQNQQSALSFIDSLNNQVHTGIILVYDMGIYYLTYKRFKALLDSGAKSIKPTELNDLKAILGGVGNE